MQDGNTDIDGIRNAIAKAKSVTDKPSLIKVLTTPQCPAYYAATQRTSKHNIMSAAGCAQFSVMPGTCVSIAEAGSPGPQVSTLIGYGSPNKAGSHDVHGAALGEPETEETRNNLQWKYPPFELPDGVKETMSRVEEVSAPLKWYNAVVCPRSPMSNCWNGQFTSYQCCQS